MTDAFLERLDATPVTDGSDERPATGSTGPRPRSQHLAGKAGLLPRQDIRTLVDRNVLRAREPWDEAQFQPASVDLRLGPRAYRVRAGFLPGRRKTVAQQLTELKADEISLEAGAVFERGCVYVVELLDRVALPDSIAAVANPKSSTGRLDVFTRLIADHSDVFDSVPGGYAGPLYAEVSPRSFSVKVRQGSRLNQIRFRRRNSQQDKLTDFRLSDKDIRDLHQGSKLVDGDLQVRKGLVLHIELGGLGGERLVGYRAQRHTDVIDVARVGEYGAEDYWEPIRARAERRLILDPDEFYILASKEKLHIP